MQPSGSLPRRHALGGSGSASSAAGGGSSGGNPAGIKEPVIKDKRVPQPKTPSQEAWNLIKSVSVKITEADGLRLKLSNAGLYLAFIDLSPT